ncbi:MAG TPA: Ig-like domain-containing protein [Synergistales bacterium]|nr:Ig-like domain-containing protein [Synergistales bacterium]
MAWRLKIMGNNKLTVVKITGEAFRQTEDRLLIPIQKGDLIPEGEIIIVKSGQVLMMDSAGNPFELSEGSSLAVGGGPAPAEIPDPVAPSPADLPAEASAHFEPSKTAAPSTPSPGSDVEEDVVQEGHSHVRLGRIQYENNSGLDYIRDVNEVFHFDTRATRNPRVSFSYDYAEGKDPFPRPEIEDPYSGWDRIPQSGWANRPPIGTSIPDQASDDADRIDLGFSGFFKDPDSDVLTYSAEGLPAGLSIDPVTGVISGTIDRSASQGGPGDDGVYTVTVTATDPHGASTSQTFTWTVTNPAPVAEDDANTTGENDPLDISKELGVLSNDSDPDGDPLSVTEFTNGTDTASAGGTISGTNGGTFTLNADGSYTFDPGTDFDYLAVNETATTSVTYTVSDGEGGTDTATLTITVTGANDGPVSTPIEGRSDFDADAISHDVSGYFSDPDASDTLTFSAEGLPEGLTIDTATGVISGTIDRSASQGGPGDDGVYTVTVTATDPHGASTSQTFTWTVTNPGPTAINDFGDVTEDTAITATGNVLGNDIDPDGDPLLVDSVDGQAISEGGSVSIDGAYGTVTINSDGSYTYNLNNTDPAIQALAHNDPYLTDTFTYTITDDEGGSSNATLTIRIHGTNDAPVISKGAGDSDSESFTETDDPLVSPDTNTLSLKDIDTTNTVETDVVSVVKSGESTYHGPLPDNLLDMLTVSGGLASGETEGKIHWTFDSGTEAFDFLPAGQKLILTYTIEAKDSYGDTDTHDVTITITGTNDVGEIIDDTGNTNEDVTLTGNVLDNDIPDPDYGESLIVSGFKVDSDGDGVQENYFAGDTVTLKTSTGGRIGTFQLNANGSYTFTPHHNYSGPVPEISYKAGNLSFDGWATLKITINPVADAPKWEVHSGVETNEDEMISLYFKMPAITDNIDENGALPGDYPERLGYIELRSVDTGAKIYKGDGTTLLFTGANNTMTIVIVDEHGNLDTTVHYTDLTSDSNYGSAIKLTQAEFEALKILPPANRHNDIDMTLRVTSYETDDSGNRDTSVPGAAASRDIHVEVLAVTDDVDLKIAGSDVSYSATIDEDTTLNLSSLLSANFDDLDGSEKRSIVIYNPEGNDPIAVNGTTVNSGSSITIDAPGLSTSTTGFPAISIGGAANISGDLKGITVTLRAQDTDSDSPGHTPAVKTDSVTLDLYVNPVAGDVTAPPVSTEEDTAVKFMEDLALTDTDGSEVMDSITIKEVPTGWVIKDSGGTVVHTGDGSSDYSVPVAHVSDGSYKDYTITPPAHSSADETLTVSVQTTDTKVVDGTTVTSTETVDLGVKVTVTPVAEVIGTDTDGDGIDDLTMSGDHTYTTHALEDTWFELNQDGFDFKTPWSNQDPDEETYALLTPKLNGGATSAIGSQFKYSEDNGNSWVTLTYNGSAPVEIPVEYLDTVEFKATPNVKGSFEIEVQAKTVDTDPDTGDKVSAVSGSATLTNGVIEPVADKVTLAVSSGLNTLEDVPVALKVRPTSSDPSETFNVTIEDIPDGAKFYYDGEELTVSSGSVTIEDYSAAKTLSILPPHNSNEDFVLKVSAVSVDSHGGITDVSDVATLLITVNVQGVADPAILDVHNFSTTEADLDSGGNAIALSEVINSASLTDTDGSETLTLVLTGLDPEFTVEGATFTGGVGTGRVWIIDTSKLASTNIVAPENYSGAIKLDVKAITTENDGDSLTGAPTPIVIEVAPSPEATITGSTTAPEDTLVPVNFSIVHQHGDTDEVLSSLWIKASDVEGKGFTLYYGNSTATTLADAAGASTPGVVLEDGYYKLTGDAIDSIYAKGAPNAHGSFDFEVKYEITDPSSDGSLPSVSNQTDDTYTLTVRAVTDATETSLGEFEFTGNASVDGTTVTAEGNTSISIPVTVTQLPDPDAGNEPDTDGSERLVRFVIDGVPDGVRVEGGVYIGDTPDHENTGQWLIEKNVAFNDTDQVIEDIVFHLEGSAALVGGLNETITITAVTQDTGSFEFRSGSSWTLVTAPVGEFDDSDATLGSPAQIITYEPTGAGVMEDTPKVLNDLVDFEITGSSPFSITLTHLPPGTVVEGMFQTTVDGQTVWTASGTGGNAELQALLDGIIVTPPENWNENNHPGGFSFSVHLTTYAEGGQQYDHPLIVSPAIEPVTDPALIEVSAPDVYEGDPVPIDLVLSNSADGEFSKIVGGKLYISLDETGMDKPGTLWYEGSQLSLTPVTGVAGVADGNYYVIEGVTDISQTVGLVYTPEAHSSGQATLTATLVGQEENASNIITNTVTGTLTVEPVNSGYDITVNDSSGNEDTKIALDFSDNGLIDNDGSESVLSAVLGNVPEGYLVFYGADEASSVAASNLGSDGFGNTSWSIPVTGGSLPAYIALLPPEHFSGTVPGLELSVYSGESTLDPTASTATFNLEVIPVADGLSITPTNTFGMEGDHIPINLNASIFDTDGSETVTLEVKGLGDYASFYSGGSLISSTIYDSGTDTYTVSGIEASKIDDLSFIQASKTGMVEVTAYTVETNNGDTSTPPVTGSFEIDIFEKIATAGDDTLLYSGKPLDGLAGEDTVIMRFNEGIDFGTDPAIRNVEIFDLRGETSGSNTLNHLSIQDVIDITDSNNTLTIFGDANDSVNIIDDGHWTTETIDGFYVYTHAIHTDVILKIQQEMMANLVPEP